MREFSEVMRKAAVDIEESPSGRGRAREVEVDEEELAGRREGNGCSKLDRAAFVNCGEERGGEGNDLRSRGCMV